MQQVYPAVFLPHFLTFIVCPQEYWWWKCWRGYIISRSKKRVTNNKKTGGSELISILLGFMLFTEKMKACLDTAKHLGFPGSLLTLQQLFFHLQASFFSVRAGALLLISKQLFYPWRYFSTHTAALSWRTHSSRSWITPPGFAVKLDLKTTRELELSVKWIRESRETKRLNKT